MATVRFQVDPGSMCLTETSKNHVLSIFGMKLIFTFICLVALGGCCFVVFWRLLQLVQLFWLLWPFWFLALVLFGYAGWCAA